MQISEIVRLSPSRRRAPATRSSFSPHCQMHSPAAVASVARLTNEETTRWLRRAKTADISTRQRPAVSAMIGEMPA